MALKFKSERGDYPKCYDCKHRAEVVYSAHSQCVSRKTREELDIQGNAIGIRKGWFAWPVNFDPVWLDNCNGFEDKTL